MIFLLANWRWLVPTAAAAALAVLLGLTRMDLAQTKAAWATERAEATKIAAEFAAKSAAADARNAELSRNLEVDHANAIAAADASAADFAERLRNARASRGGCVPTPAAHPADPAQPAAGSDRGRGNPDPGTRLRDVVLRLQADVKLCTEWANKVGR